MIFLLLGFILMIIAWKSYKRGFLIFLVFNLFLNTNVTVISVPGLPFLGLEVLLSLYFICLWFRDKSLSKIERVRFPFTRPFSILVAAWFISTLLSMAGFIMAFPPFIKDTCSKILVVWLIWKTVTPRDIPFLLKWFGYAFIIIGCYAFYERSIEANPLIEYEISLVNDTNRAVNFIYYNDVLRGYRVQSVFEHCIGGGINWSIYTLFCLVIYINFNVRLPKTQMIITSISVLLSILCIFMTNSRGPIVFFFLSCISLFKMNNKRFYQFAIIAIAVIIALSPFFMNFTDNILSIVDSNMQDKVGGSNADMRFEQLKGAFEIMSKSPIWGLGYKFDVLINATLRMKLLGFESMWFSIMPTFGILGIIANIIFAYYSIIKIPRTYKSKPALWIAIAYWVTASLTSVPGLRYYLYFLIYIMFIKLSPVYVKQSHYIDRNKKRNTPVNNSKNKIHEEIFIVPSGRHFM